VAQTRTSSSSQQTGIRLAASAGLLSIPLGVAGVLIDRMWTLPASGASSAQIAVFVSAHRSALLVAMILTTATVGLWLWFGVGVWRWMQAGTEQESVLSGCFLVGLVSFTTLYRAPAPSDPRLLYDLAFGLLAMSGVPTALALGAYAEHAYRSARAGPSAVLGLLGAVAHLLLLASFVLRSGFFSIDGGVTIAIPATLFAWIAATALAMLDARPSARPLGSPA